PASVQDSRTALSGTKTDPHLKPLDSRLLRGVQSQASSCYARLPVARKLRLQESLLANLPRQTETEKCPLCGIHASVVLDRAVPVRSEEPCVHSGRNDLALQSVFAVETALHRYRVAKQIVAAQHCLLPQTNRLTCNGWLIPQVRLRFHSPDGGPVVAPTLTQP